MRWGRLTLHALRGLAAPELRLLIVALALACAALSAVGLVAARFDAALSQRSAELLGGDLVIDADAPLPPDFAVHAASLGLRTATSVSFASMAVGDGGRTRLVDVRAVGPGYPLYGAVACSPRCAGRGPARGDAWVAPALGRALGLAPGGSVGLGAAHLRVDALIESEPDRGMGLAALAPRVMLDLADLPATALLQPASRATWRLALAGPAPSIAAYSAWARQRAASLRGVRMSRAGGDDAFSREIGRAADFLQLVALLAAVLAALTVAACARRWSAERVDTMALLKALGLRRRGLFLLAGAELLAVGMVGAVSGVALGALGAALLLHLLGGVAGVADLPPAGWGVPARAAALTLLLLAVLTLGPLLGLARAAPLRVLRHEPAGRSGWLSAAAGLAVFAAALLWQARDRSLAAWVIGGAAVLALGFTAGARALLAAATVPRGRGASALARRSLRGRSGAAALQVGALALALGTLMLAAMLSRGLLSGWRADLPAGAPNRFVINILPGTEAAFRAALATAGIRDEDFAPMVRGRLVAIDGRPVHGADYPAGRARDLIEREFNLSSAERVPAHDRVSAGSWAAGGLSLDSGIAATLGLRLGQRLAFDVAGTRVESRVTSLRQVDWGSMHVNFFVLLPPRLLDGLPRTSIAAFHETDPGLDAVLARDFPAVTIIDVGAILARLQDLLTQLGTAVQLLFSLVLGAGLALVAAVLLLQRSERTRDIAVCRVLGAGDSLLRRAMLVEHAALGALAGLLGTGAAAVAAHELAARVFHFAWLPGPLWLLAGVLGGATLTAGLAAAGLAPLLRRSPLRVLRA